MSNLFQKISRAGLVLVLIGAALLWFSLGDAIISLKAPKSFDDVLEYGVAPGDHVKGSVPYLLDVYATLETWSENTKTHSVSNKKTSFQYYVLPAGDGYVGMAISSKNFSAADKLVDQTYDFLLDGGGIPTAREERASGVLGLDSLLFPMDHLRKFKGQDLLGRVQLCALPAVHPVNFLQGKEGQHTDAF